MGTTEEHAAFDPFVEDADEIHLDSNFLATVLAQIRFPTSINAGKREVAEEVAVALQAEYPVFDVDSTVAIMVTSDGPVSTTQKEETIWRFRSRQRDWQVSLASTFVSLDTTAYVSRKDFLDRLTRVLAVVSTIVSPVECSRIGVRYVDRFEADDIADRLSEMVRSELLDAHALPTTSGAALVHSVCESRFSIPDGSALQMRWGGLPPKALYDPSIKPVDSRSWILDFDMFDEGNRDFDPGLITERAQGFATRAYAFFRWAMKDDFLRSHGSSV